MNRRVFIKLLGVLAGTAVVGTTANANTKPTIRTGSLNRQQPTSTGGVIKKNIRCVSVDYDGDVAGGVIENRDALVVKRNKYKSKR